jgi:hypothetical protein
VRIGVAGVNRHSTGKQSGNLRGCSRKDSGDLFSSQADGGGLLTVLAVCVHPESGMLAEHRRGPLVGLPAIIREPAVGCDGRQRARSAVISTLLSRRFHPVGNQTNSCVPRSTFARELLSSSARRWPNPASVAESDS